MNDSGDLFGINEILTESEKAATRERVLTGAIHGAMAARFAWHTAVMSFDSAPPPLPDEHVATLVVEAFDAGWHEATCSGHHGGGNG